MRTSSKRTLKSPGIARIAAELNVPLERAERFYAAAQEAKTKLKTREGARSLETVAIAVGHAILDHWGHISKRRNKNRRSM